MRIARAATVAGLAGLLTTTMWTGPAAGASHPGPQAEPAATCPAGTTPDQPGPGDQARPVIEGNAAAMDPVAHKLVMVNDEGPTWTFNVCTNRWRKVAPLRFPGPERRLRAVYDSAADRVLVYNEGAFATYNVQKDTWTRFGKAFDAVKKAQGQDYAFYDPAADRVVVFTTQNAAVWSYAPSTRRWHKLDVGPRALRPHHWLDFSVVTLDPARRQLIAFRLDSKATWTFDLASLTWARHLGRTPALSVGWAPSGGEVAFDATADRALAFSDGKMFRYDPTAGTWTRARTRYGPLLHRGVDAESGPTGSLARMGHTLVYDPLNGRTVLLGGNYRTRSMWRSATEVLAYTVTTNTWSTLVRRG